MPALAAPPPAADAAPAAAPKPSPGPATAPTPAAATPPPKDYVSEYEADLDALDDNRPPPKKEDKPKGVVQPPKGEGEATNGEHAAADQPPAAAADLDGPEPVKIVELRQWGRSLKKQIKEQYKPEVAKLQARVKELEQTTAVPQEVATKLETLQKRNQQLEEQIGFVDYSKSAAFQEQFSKPYQAAWQRAVSDFNQLQVRLPDGTDPESGEAKFKFRPANDQDLLALANLPLSEMDDKAEAMFGRSAARVIRHVEKVRELAIAQEEALENARKTAGARIAEQETNKKLTSAKGQQMWQAEHKRLVEKYPHFFGPDEADPEGNILLQKGKAQADRIFVPTKDNAPKSPEEAVRLHALAYNKIANHDRIARRLKMTLTELAEVKKALAEYEESNPPAGKGGDGARRQGGASEWSVDAGQAELDTLDKR